MKMKLTFSALLLFLFCAVFADTFVENVPINVDQAKLQQGELQIFTFKQQISEKETLNRAIGVLLIDAPPEKVWEVLADWDSMGGFVKDLDYYKTKKVLSKPGEPAQRSLIEGQIRVGLIKIRYTLETTFLKSHYRQSWRLVKNPEIKKFQEEGVDLQKNSAGIKNIEGFEYIQPYDGGKKTIYYYAPIVEISLAVPKSWELSISRKSLKGYMLGVRGKVTGKKYTE